MSLSGRVSAAVALTLTSALDLATGQVPLIRTVSWTVSDGTGSGQANRLWHDQRTLAASATENLDLAGSLADAFGATVTFARVKGLLIAASSANSNAVVVGAAASNAWSTWVGASTHTVTVRPGGVLLLTAPDATAYAVTAGTGDILKIANGGAGTSVTYDIVILGASA